MSGSGAESKDEIQDSIIDADEQVSRSDFLRKLVAGGVISVAAVSGLGGLQKVFGETNTISENGGKTDITDLIKQVEELSRQLGMLQNQFANAISGKLKIPELVVDKMTTSDGLFIKLDVPENGFLKIEGDAAFLKLDVPENGFMKIEGDSSFHKLTVPENGFLKLDGEATFQKCVVPETGFIKIDGDATFLKLDVPENGFMKITGEASFLKLDATEITAQKVVAGSIITKTPTTAS